MKKYIADSKKYFKMDSIICDRCKKEYTDPLEIQEFQSFDFTGGYGSVFGDMNKVECDLCQYCLNELIGPIARIDYYDQDLL
jgi:hypothetical protein